MIRIKPKIIVIVRNITEPLVEKNSKKACLQKDEKVSTSRELYEMSEKTLFSKNNASKFFMFIKLCLRSKSISGEVNKINPKKANIMDGKMIFIFFLLIISTTDKIKIGAIVNRAK